MTTQETINQAYELASETAKRLTTELGVPVWPLCFLDGEENEPIVGYIKEPSRQVKIAVMDKNMVAPFSAAAEMYDIILIRNESDPRMWPDGPQSDDAIYMGAANAAWDRVKLKIDQFAKKKLTR